MQRLWTFSTAMLASKQSTPYGSTGAISTGSCCLALSNFRFYGILKSIFKGTMPSVVMKWKPKWPNRCKYWVLLSCLNEMNTKLTHGWQKYLSLGWVCLEIQVVHLPCSWHLFWSNNCRWKTSFVPTDWTILVI